MLISWTRSWKTTIRRSSSSQIIKIIISIIRSLIKSSSIVKCLSWWLSYRVKMWWVISVFSRIHWNRYSFTSVSSNKTMNNSDSYQHKYHYTYIRYYSYSLILNHNFCFILFIESPLSNQNHPYLLLEKNLHWIKIMFSS